MMKLNAFARNLHATIIHNNTNLVKLPEQIDYNTKTY